MDNAGLLLQGIPVGVIVDVYSHEQIDRFNYPIALSED